MPDHLKSLATLAPEAQASTAEAYGHPPYKLACMEVWGGNRKVARSVELPGLAGWVYSKPLEPATAGGDVHYLSVCNQGALSRVAVADVMGHGQAVSSVAEDLRELMHKHINTWDQSNFMRELNNAFHKRRKEYATVVVLGFYRQTGQVVYTNAGHPRPLWYRAAAKKWDLLEENTPYAEAKAADLPLGLIPGTDYYQTAVQLNPADLLVFYTDGLTEAVNEAGQELGSERLRELTRAIAVDSPVAAGRALLAFLQAFRNGTSVGDDQTLVVLQRLST